MTNGLILLHLSDIHFSAFEGDPSHNLEDRVRDFMLEDIKEMRRRLGEMQAVLVVGDIAGAGKKHEYDIAAGFLDQTCAIVGCETDRVICIPGNHDIDRDKCDLVHTAVRQYLRRMNPEEVSDRLHQMLREDRGAELLLSPLTEYNAFALRYGCDLKKEQLTWAPKTFSLGRHELIVYGVTSSWICDENDSASAEARNLRGLMPTR